MKGTLDDLFGNKVRTPAPDIPPQGEKPDDDDTLALAQMDGRYSTLRPSNKVIERMHVILRDGSVLTYQYIYLDAMSAYTGGKFVITFAGAKHWELTVEGINLWRIYDYITQRRWPYIREEHRSFEDKGEHITAIRIKDVTPRYAENA